MNVLKRRIFLCLLFSGLIPSIGIANDGAFYSQGSTLIPIKHTTISLKKEVLTLNRKGNRLNVDVVFEFFNPGAERTETVGFVTPPCYGENYNIDLTGTLPDISYFTVEANGTPVQYKISRLGKSGFRLPVAIDTAKKDFVYYFKIKFNAGMNIIHHTYTMRANQSPYMPVDFQYRLTTGNSWANGEMEDFTLHIDMGSDDLFKIPSTFNKDGRQVDWAADSSAKISCGRRWYTFEDSEDTTTDCFVMAHSGGITFHTMHFKPDFDLDFGEINLDRFDEFHHALQKKHLTEYFRITDSAEITAMSDRELHLCKNYLFALHNCEFENKELTQFFEQFTWYFPYTNRVPDVHFLDKTEQHALAIIVQEEKRRPHTKPTDK
ncbi:MAG: YARHG domain-containing protein [Candidatus Kapaibacterium sp.]